MMPPEWPWPRIFAHRGGGVLAPENTLEAFDVAARFGTGVEFDVMLSAALTPRLIHDETLERTTSGRGQVATSDDATLDRLDASCGMQGFAGARVPRLEAAARRCEELALAVNLEIKPSRGTEQLTGSIVAALAQRCWRDATLPPLLSSFSDEALAAAAQAAPQLPRGLLVEHLPIDWKARCTRLGAVALHADAANISHADMRAVREAGLWLVLYTENDPQHAARLFAWGAHAIITDRPDLLRPPGGSP